MLGWFVETTMVASALAAVAALAGRVRPIGPTARHVLWLAVLVRLMTPPMVCWPWAVTWHDMNIDWPMPSRRAEPAVGSPASAPGDEGEAPTSPGRSAEAAAVVADLTMPRDPAPGRTEPGAWVGIERALFVGWLAATGFLAAGQAWRILRFRRRLRSAVPAPDDLVAEAGRIAGQLGGWVPDLLVVPGIGTPMLWCLGRPRLLIPAPLVRTIGRERWRAILVHELAHLRRGDHWISRLELLAGLFWWWNPLYWLTRARIDAEAELACDAWVVWALPGDRLAYAETLFDIGSRLSRAASPAPALGAAGSGRFLERRLTMILRETVPCRLSPTVLLAAVLLVLLAMPSWSAIPPAAAPPRAPAPALATPADPGGLASPIDNDDDADADDDDDDDDDAARARQKAKRDEAQAKRQEARAKRDEARAKREEARAKEAKARAKARSEGKKGDGEAEAENEFEKKMEAFGREVEAKFGPGSEFEKKMEAFGKEMEAKFGPGSEFEKQMKKLGEEMEAKFGPGSEFEKKMKKLGEELQSKLGPGSEFEKQIKEATGKLKAKAEAAARKGAEAGADVNRAEERLEWARRMREKGYVSNRQLQAEQDRLKQAKEAKAKAKAGAEKDKTQAKGPAKERRREARIAALEAQIRKLNAELKALESEDDEDER